MRVLTESRAIAKGFHTELNDHSHDLLGSIIVKHYVAGRPQCPTCDSKSCRICAGRRRRRSPGAGRYRGDLTNLPFDEKPPHSVDQPTASRFRSP